MTYANNSTALYDYVKQSAFDMGVYPGQEIPPEYNKQFNNDNTITIERDMLNDCIKEIFVVCRLGFNPTSKIREHKTKLKIAA